ncbi:MAG: ROK family protein [Paracoccaceae bacterium]
MTEIEKHSGIAIDFGGTKIAAARVENGIIVERIQTRTDGDASVGDQISAITNLAYQLDISQQDRLAVAVSGRVSSDGVWHALNTETLTKVEAVPLRDILSDAFSRPVKIENDATAAAFGEYLAGACRGYEACGFITVSTGIGGGIILSGKPVISKTGLAGHMGFSTSRIAKEVCGSGRDKTIESIASGKAIARYARKSGHTDMDAKAVFEAHLDGVDWATDLIETSAKAVAELCANLAAILDLEIIALGGSIGLAQGYLDLVQDALMSEPEIFRPKLAQAELGADAALIGVLAL